MSFNIWPWGNKRKTMLGITSRSHENNFQWLVEIVRINFSDLLEVKYLPITNSNRYDWEDKVRACSAVILYHTKNQGRVNITDVDGSLYDEELRYLSDRLGREKVVVMVDDMEDTSENTWHRILTAQPSLYHLASHLILIPERNKTRAADRKLEELFYYFSKGERMSLREQKSAYTHPPYSLQTAGPSSLTKEDQKYSSSISSSSSSSGPSIPRPPRPHSPYRVGFFSRSAYSNYTWLMDSLKIDPRLRSAEINAFSISNHYGSFRSGLLQSDFAILYHTKNQGRINITDVIDALYDKELREMSDYLEKDNVIVVIDDMESSESAVKDRILRVQFSIRKYAKDLFLFTEKKKELMNLEQIRVIIQMRMKTSVSWQIESIKHNIQSYTSEGVRRVRNIPMSFRKNSTSTKSKQPPHPPYRLGIFSRSAHSNYKWLMDSLKTDPRLQSAKINAFSVSNHYESFSSGLHQCDFAILYHTKNQGRINITDVTDSLYDNELQEMSHYLGRENVIVVVDDLQSCEPEVKYQILDNQPKIRLYAKDLILFTESKKHTINLVEIREIICASLTKFLAQFSVLDTAHPTDVHRDGESSMTDAGSSVDLPDNQTAQDKETTSAASPSCSQSDSHQKSDTAEPQSKRLKTTPDEETDSIDENSQQEKEQLTLEIEQLSIENTNQKTLKENRSQEETIKKQKGENLYQKENIKELKNTALHSERETRKMSVEEKRNEDMEESRENLEEKKMMISEEMDNEEASHEEEVQEEATGTKTLFQEKEERAYRHRTDAQELERLPKKDLQNPAGAMSQKDLTMRQLMTRYQEMIKDKDLKIKKLELVIQRLGNEMQKQGEQIQKQGEEIKKQGDEMQKQGEEIQRRGEEIQKQGEEIKKQGDEMQKQGEEIQRRGEEIQKQGEDIQRQGEEIQRRAEEIKWQGEEIQRRGEKIKRKGEAIQRVEEEIEWQGEEIHRLGEEIQKQRIEIQDLNKEIWRQKNEILTYEFLCNEMMGDKCKAQLPQ